jgi:hypothetical protein
LFVICHDLVNWEKILAEVSVWIENTGRSIFLNEAEAFTSEGPTIEGEAWPMKLMLSGVAPFSPHKIQEGDSRVSWSLLSQATEEDRYVHLLFYFYHLLL